MTQQPGDIRVGIAGWTFPPWRGQFYPKTVKQKDELAYAARQFRTLEINGTFYSMQRPKTFADWDAATPADFVFSMKGPRFITHMKRLKDCAAPLANFLASGVLRLGPKLGPILWQLPPNLAFEPARLEEFLALLPQDRVAAAKLAAQHEPRMAGRAFLDPGEPGPVRHALEARHDSFADPDCLALLRRHNVALAITDGHAEWPQLRDVTADFLYVRLHLSQALGEGRYAPAALAAWAKRAATWAKGGQPEDGQRVLTEPPPPLARRDVFLYCDAAGDETVKLHTPANAQALAECLRRQE